MAGKEQAHTLLRQSVHFCVGWEQYRLHKRLNPSTLRALLPKLLDQYKLVGRPLGKREAEDAWVVRLAETVCGNDRDRAADAEAAALAEEMSPEDVGEAISLAASPPMGFLPSQARLFVL